MLSGGKGVPVYLLGFAHHLSSDLSRIKSDRWSLHNSETSNASDQQGLPAGGFAARAMARHAGYRKRSGPRHGACVARGRIAKAPVSAEAATGTHQWLHRRREVEASVPRWRAPYSLCYAEAETGPTTVPILLNTRMQARYAASGADARHDGAQLKYAEKRAGLARTDPATSPGHFAQNQAWPRSEVVF